MTIPRRQHDGPGRLSFPQERLFLLDRIMPGRAAYNVPTLVRVRAHLDAERLEQAARLVVSRHEVLRTRIRLRDGEPVAEVADDTHVELRVWDARANAPGELGQDEATALLAELARRPFDLGADTLLRVGVVHVADEEDLLLVVLHHAGSDHVSSNLLFAELDAAYSALAAGAAPELPELSIQYGDYAEWQREHLSGEQLDELLDYWTAQLAGAPERLELPSDRPRPAAQSYRGALREFTIPAAEADAVRALARGQGTSTFMVLLAAFAALVHRYTAVEDLVVGVPVSGRHYDEIASLLGYFSNTLALRTDLSGEPTFAELLARVKTTTLEAQIYQELPFEKLVEALSPERAQSHSPLFQVLFGYDVAPERRPTLAGSELERLPPPGWEWARFDLSIIVRESGDGSLHAMLEYATDLFDPSTIERLIGHYSTLLAAATADPERHLWQLDLLADDEREELTVSWNDTEAPFDRRCLHHLFAEQALATPDAIAVEAEGERVTFAMLDRRSNQLARELISRGVGADCLVGISMDRSRGSGRVPARRSEVRRGVRADRPDLPARSARSSCSPTRRRRCS